MNPHNRAVFLPALLFFASLSPATTLDSIIGRVSENSNKIDRFEADALVRYKI
jgi:hypothetical protein